MFDRYNDQARRVIILAQEEARALNHHYIGTEHLLLALTRDGNAASGPVLATRVLASLNVRHDNVRQLVLGGGQGATNFDGHVPFTPHAKRALELAWHEALVLGSNYISAEHILLALARQDEGFAANMLNTLATGPIREEVFGAFADNPPKTGTDGLHHQLRSRSAKEAVGQAGLRLLCRHRLARGPDPLAVSPPDPSAVTLAPVESLPGTSPPGDSQSKGSPGRRRPRRAVGPS